MMDWIKSNERRRLTRRATCAIITALLPAAAATRDPCANPSGEEKEHQLARRESAKTEGGSTKAGRKLLRLSRRASNKERHLLNTADCRRARRQRSVSLDACEQPSTSSSEFEITDPILSQRISQGQGEWARSSKRWSRRLSRSIRRSKKSPEAAHDKKRRGSVMNANAALFEAVETNDVERMRKLLMSPESMCDLNSANEDGLTVLDVALLTDNRPISHLLMTYGARSNLTDSTEELLIKLEKLYTWASKCTMDLKFFSSSPLLLNGCVHQKENEKMANFWESRKTLYGHMKTVYKNSKVPTELNNVTLSAASSSSALVKFDRPCEACGTTIVIKYKVEWSRFENFVPLVGEHIIDVPLQTEYEISGLVCGNTYFVRVSAGSIKGFGRPVMSDPPSIIPSNWKELDDFQPRWENKLQILDELFINSKNFQVNQPSDEDVSSSVINLQLPTYKSSMKRSIRSLFTSSPKFQRTLKRGVYLTALICHEDRILVTSDDNIPTVAVDDVFSTNSTLNNDYYWLLKVACTWKDVKSLKQKLETSCSPGTMQFRCCLLQAVTQLQSALGLEDLGQFHHHPLRDSNGSVILVTVRHVSNLKTVGKSPNVKWSSLEKVQRKCSTAYDSDATAFDMLGTIVSDLSVCQKAKCTHLAKGLYLGYLKLHSSVDRICIMAPQRLPNVLPYAKIRDCPNVTKEEWRWVRDVAEGRANNEQPVFQNQLITACRTLLTEMGIDKSEWSSHRLHDVEVIEMNADVAFLLLLPNAQNICAIPGHVEQTHHTCTMVPIQVFEMNHMHTYKYDFMSRYSRLSSTLEIDQHLAQQSVRQAFSNDEVAAARQRIHQLGQIQLKLDEAWRGIRWTMDVIVQARDRTGRGGLTLDLLFHRSTPNATSSDA